MAQDEQLCEGPKKSDAPDTTPTLSSLVDPGIDRPWLANLDEGYCATAGTSCLKPAHERVRTSTQGSPNAPPFVTDIHRSRSSSLNRLTHSDPHPLGVDSYDHTHVSVNWARPHQRSVIERSSKPPPHLFSRHKVLLPTEKLASKSQHPRREAREVFYPRDKVPVR